MLQSNIESDYLFAHLECWPVPSCLITTERSAAGSVIRSVNEMHLSQSKSSSNKLKFYYLLLKSSMAWYLVTSLIHIKTITCYSLRSTEGVLLKHPSGRMKKSFGDRSFSVAAPTLWNALPVSLRMIKCISTFKSNLKTYLFKLAFNIS